ncbi:aldo/keto reductase [Fructobacillus fructosus]|uniref:Related to diketogulonate reductase (ARA1) n=1 Tax=Fructobacillus fructosus TaxID=1631 RepID=A0ABM9N0E1_9LACO|nr:Aldo/keto reductase [Fructobacillus fructosus]CAK1250090.1 Aldo/keto reductase [Fructobacillus fructosus]CAK1252362.1 Aldo/keto reductase [Fructobacillus fructosus]CAK1252429.1 Aldo/keto reductase [Fructobacillus fructosus]CAK1252606.1 Aldo/keto reductase [Fructobacillus fructosus]
MDYKTLANGIKMPILGFGVFQVKEAGAAKQAVIDAIKAGYRLIDTAASYGNEKEVGEGIEEAIATGLVKREELFITSKMWVADVSVENAAQAIQESLKRLKLDYLDLYLIHQPYNDVFAAWRAMEAAYQKGQLKAIGVSNFSIDQLTNLTEFNEVKPMVNQIEVNPFEQQQEAAKYFADYGVQVEAWAPFAEGRNNLFTNPTLQKIADKYNKSIAQVVLRWISQRGVVVLAKSTKPARMAQNLDVLDFTLTKDEMKTITSLDTNTSQFFDHTDPDMIKWMASRDIDY